MAAVATTIKLLPVPMFLAALTDRRSRLTAVVSLAVIVAVSVVLAPQAWVDFTKVLPNTLQIGMATSRTNLSPAHAFSEFGLVGLGTVIGWGLAIGFGVAAIATGLREGYSNRVLAMAVFCGHLRVVHAVGPLSRPSMVPLILWAWPAVGTRRRMRSPSSSIITTGLWIRLDPSLNTASRSWRRSSSAASRSRPCVSVRPPRQVPLFRMPARAT